MKRAFSLFTVICFIFLFSSCKKEVNMEYLTEYQRNNFSAEIIIEQGKEKYSAEIENSGGTLYLRFTEPSGLSPFVFKRSDGTLSLSVHGTEIPFTENSLKFISVIPVVDIFSVPVSGIWKISEENISGVELYVCRNDGVCLYIDKNSRLPIKALNDSTTVNIISFKRISE